MLSSVGIQSASKIHPSNPLLTRNSLQNHVSTIPKTLFLPKSIKTSSSSQTLTLEESISDDKNAGKKKRGVVLKPLEKPRLVLKLVWMESNIGIALDLQVIPGGQGTIPLSPYYFLEKEYPWEKDSDSWKDLKVMLESKQWISMRKRIVLLNQASEIINLWRSTRVEI